MVSVRWSFGLRLRSGRFGGSYIFLLVTVIHDFSATCSHVRSAVREGGFGEHTSLSCRGGVLHC
jgi:hypothetical protein